MSHIILTDFWKYTRVNFKKIANTQSQINLCNTEINKINSTIAANKAEINKKNEEIDEQKLSFKKRLRAIRMSNTGSN